MARIYLKEEPTDMKVLKVAKELGADYIEDGSIIFKMPTMQGTSRLAIKFDYNGSKCVTIGVIDDSCDNFSKGTGGMFIGELDWCMEILDRLIKSKLVKKFRTR